VFPPSRSTPQKYDHSRTECKDTLPIQAIYRPELGLQKLIVRTVLSSQLFVIVVLRFKSGYTQIPSAASGSLTRTSSWPSLLSLPFVREAPPNP
jgi:hypothetical protein